MKFNMLPALFFAAIILISNSTHAVTVSAIPDSSAVEQGGALTVDLWVSDLGDGTAPSVGVFDLDLSFDHSILGLSNVTFGNQLDLFGFGSLQLIDSTVAGNVNLFELSFDLPSDLDTLQTPSFVLASVMFDALAIGSSSLLVSVNALGDSLGFDLFPSITGASVDVTAKTTTPVSIPSVLWLMVMGFTLMQWSYRKPKGF